MPVSLSVLIVVGAHVRGGGMRQTVGRHIVDDTHQDGHVATIIQILVFCFVSVAVRVLLSQGVIARLVVTWVLTPLAAHLRGFPPHMPARCRDVALRFIARPRTLYAARSGRAMRQSVA